MYDSTTTAEAGTGTTNWTNQTSVPSTVSTRNGSNEDGADWDQEQPLTEFRTIILPCIYAIVTVIGLIGNGLVIYIMQVKVRNRSITDVYVLNLAIADFIFVSMLPLWTTELGIGGWPFGGAMCKIASGCTYFDMYASVFFMTALSVDRFTAVVMYQTVHRTKFRARIIVISIWIFSSALGVLPMYFRGIVDQGSDLPKCGWTFNNSLDSHNSWFMVYTMTRSVVGFLIPLLIILVCYSMIIIFLKTRGTTGKLTEKRQDRATKIVLVVIGVFLVCWLPNQISNLFYVIDTLRDVESAPEHYYVHMFTTTLAWAHSCVNPILYAFMREDLRKKIIEIYYNIENCCSCGRSKRKVRVTYATEISFTPKTEKRIKPTKDENTQFLRLTQIDGVHKISNESLAVSNGTSSSLNPNTPTENGSLLAKSPISSRQDFPNQMTRSVEHTKNAFQCFPDAAEENDVDPILNDHLKDKKTSTKIDERISENSYSEDRRSVHSQESVSL